VLASSGTPLPGPIRNTFESRFGHDFGTVRIHDDPLAAQSANDVQALAYTVGPDIVFATGQFAPETLTGQRLLAHELTHVIQQGATGGQVVRRSPAGVIQRQPAPVRRTSPVNPEVSSDKWRTDVEAAYRRAGFTEAANAVHNCREFGMCANLLTISQAWKAYNTGRLEANLGPPPESGPGHSAPNSPNGVAMAGMAAPALVPAARSLVPAATSAAERAALAWGVESASVVVPEAATVATATLPEAAAATAPVAGSGAAAVGTVAVPVAIGVVLVLSIIDLVGWARFQTKLANLGFIILPDPLGTCIQNCHQAPKYSPQPSFPDFEPIPGRDPFPRLDPDKLKDWLGPQNPQPTPAPTPTPTPTPVPVPNPDPTRRRRPQPEIILRLPPQKAVHASRYRSLIAARRLVHLYDNPRTQDAQAQIWDRALRPPGGQMAMYQEIWDRFEAMGMPPARRLRPNWSRRMWFRFPMQVDHIIELQVCPPGEMAIWDSFANYELLDQASNGSSGPQLAANIRAERNRLVAVTGDFAWLVRDLVFTQLEVMAGEPGQRWQADEIQQGQHYHARRRLLGEIR
jgi:hypothetical protein